MYKHGYEQEDIFVEQGTERVPDDGRFHIVYRGHAIESEATLKRALGRLQQVRANPPSEQSLADGSHEKAKLLQGEMATRHLRESTADKTSRYGRK